MTNSNEGRTEYPKNVMHMIFRNDNKRQSSNDRKEAFSDIRKHQDQAVVASSGGDLDKKQKETNTKSSPKAWTGDLDDEKDDRNLQNWPKNLLSAVIIMMLITLLLSSCALAAPYWTVHGASDNTFPFKTSEGLLMACTYPYTANITCSWLYYTNKPDLVISTAILWLTGTLGLTAFVVMSCCLCTSTCRGVKLATVTAMGVLLPNFCFLLAVILWGVHSGETFGQSEEHYHDWAYYLAIIVSIISSILTAMLLKLMCVFRKLSTRIHSEIF